jgi:hypothetical protein
MRQHSASAPAEHETLAATLGKTTAAFSCLNDYVERLKQVGAVSRCLPRRTNGSRCRRFRVRMLTYT